MKTKCLLCGQPLVIDDGRYAKSATKNFFCCHVHYVGAVNAGLARSGRKQSSTTESAGRQRARRMYEKGPCSVCGSLPSQIHHIDGNPLNNDASNIAILCLRHHMEADGRIDRLRALGKERGPTIGRQRADNGSRDGKGRFVA